MSDYRVEYTVRANRDPLQNLDDAKLTAKFLPLAFAAAAKARVLGVTVTREASPTERGAK